MITLEGINKSFGDKQVLHDISATFEPGKTNVIIGASGHGKSVLMKCMVGLLKPDNGHIYYDDKDFIRLEDRDLREVRRKIGMLFQGTALFDSSTVEENVEFPLKMFTDMSREERLERVNFCLRRVNMVDTNHKYPAEISGGMKKRVGIARAIALEIDYLFCDEPNSGLDPITSRVIDELIKEITEEYQITTIMNTHDMKTVFDIGEKVYFIYHGKNWWEGSKEEILHAENKELKAFLAASFFK
jgi:phospholipid/cholesterol/gamma-HCH transport system ATP-binding protein